MWRGALLRDDTSHGLGVSDVGPRCGLLKYHLTLPLVALQPTAAGGYPGDTFTVSPCWVC
jgi:hypothetical protein